MELQHVNVRIFVDGDLALDRGSFIEVFHRWIQRGTLQELLIDVADYRHVPDGPGVLLVGHKGDYSIDSTAGRTGLRYNRKAPLDGSNQDRFLQAFTSAARACRLLEREFASSGALKFSRNEFELFVNDRGFAPNTPLTYAACKPDVEALVKDSLGHDEFNIDHDRDPRRRFGVTVKLTQPFDLEKITEASG